MDFRDILMVAAAQGGGGVPSAPTTWDPLKKGDGITLSGGNLIATGSVPWDSVLGTKSRSSTGSFIVTPGSGAGSGTGVGFGNISTNVESYLGSDTNSVMLLGIGLVYYNNGTSSGPTFGGGDAVEAEWNSAGTVRFRVNGGTWSTPLSVPGLGAAVFPGYAASLNSPGTGNFTAWDA